MVQSNTKAFRIFRTRSTSQSWSQSHLEKSLNSSPLLDGNLSKGCTSEFLGVVVDVLVKLTKELFLMSYNTLCRLLS